MAQINGIAHIQLSVRDMNMSIPFYRTLLESLEMVVLIDDQDYFYCIGGRTGIAISPANAGTPDFNQRAPGLHHLCLRARSEADIDEIFETAKALGANIVRPPEHGEYAPGYYSVLFEDPDGIRIEANYIPGKGHLEGR